MPATYEPIATTTLGTATGTVTFSSIPQTYTDLVLVINGAITSGNDATYFRLNNDSGTNYSQRRIYGNGSSTASDGGGNLDTGGGQGWYSTSSDCSGILNFMNYSNTTTNKTIISRNNAISNMVSATVNLWRSTSAINRIDMSAFGTTFKVGTTFTLYGIKSA